MAIVIPDIDELFDIAQAFLQTYLPNMSISLDTVEGARLKSLCEALFGLYYEVKGIEDDLFPQDCGSDALIKHAQARLGDNPRRGATKSKVVDGLRVYGTAASTFLAGATLIHNDGTRYVLLEGGTIPASPLYIDVTAESVDTGTVVNKEADEVLTFEYPPSGITGDAILQSDMTGGLNEESDDELRARLIQAYRNPPAGGRASDYWSWAMSVDGVGGAYVYCPHSGDTDSRRGLGTVDIMITAAGQDSDDREPSATLISDVQDIIDANRPCCVSSALVKSIDPALWNINLTIEIESDAYDWDWTADPAGHQIQSWDSGTKKITWDSSVPQSLKDFVDAGGNPRIKTSRGDQIFTVSSYGADWVIINETPDDTPTATDDIYPGGPLTLPAITAIQNLINSLGPAKGTAADPNQTNWDDTIRISALYDIIKSIEGVKDLTLVFPVANLTPSDPGDPGLPELLCWANIVVYPS